MAEMQRQRGAVLFLCQSGLSSPQVPLKLSVEAREPALAVGSPLPAASPIASGSPHSGLGSLPAPGTFLLQGLSTCSSLCPRLFNPLSTWLPLSLVSGLKIWSLQSLISIEELLLRKIMGLPDVTNLQSVCLHPVER